MTFQAALQSLNSLNLQSFNLKVLEERRELEW